MMKKTKRFRRVIALLAVLSILSAAAFAENAAPAAPQSSELHTADRPVHTAPVHITVGNTTRVSGAFFTSQFGNNTSDIDVRAMIHGYDPVYWENQIAFSTDPTVVEELQTANVRDGVCYTVTLRRGLTYNDGITPVTAEDYVFAYLLESSPEFAAIGAKTGNRGQILGWDEWSRGEADTLAGIRLLNDYAYSVTVRADHMPSFTELNCLSITPCPVSVIAPGCAVRDNGSGCTVVNADPDAAEPLFTAELLTDTVLGEHGYLHEPSLTCGPYSLTGYDPASGRVDFALNPYYAGNYDGVTPYIDTVTLVQVNAGTMIGDLTDGRVDLLNKCVDKTVIDSGLSSMSAGNIRMQNYARLGYGFLAISCEKGPQQFTPVRQALACCLDADRFVNEYLGGYGLPVYGYYGLGQWMTYAVLGSVIPDNASEEEAEKWAELSLDGLDPYDADTDRALKLLTRDGWTLNERGESFTPGTDTLRYKKTEDGSLMPLRFAYARSTDNAASDLAAEMLEEAFAELGAEMTVTDVTFPELLADYYRENGERRYDLYFLATNFVSVFDPYMHFVQDERFSGSMNTSGIDDEQLRSLAWDMHSTEPFNELEYEQKWLRFQQRFNEILPTVPLYSNMYFDFMNLRLHNYTISSETNWPTALLYAWAE